jgi:hypothetical protein
MSLQRHLDQVSAAAAISKRTSAKLVANLYLDDPLVRYGGFRTYALMSG